MTYFLVLVKRGLIISPGVSEVSHYKQFWKSASSDITSGRVNLDVRWIDQSISLPRGLYQVLLIYPSYIYVDAPTRDVRRGRFSKRLVAANHTHTWWNNMSPLISSFFSTYLSVRTERYVDTSQPGDTLSPPALQAQWFLSVCSSQSPLSEIEWGRVTIGPLRLRSSTAPSICLPCQSNISNSQSWKIAQPIILSISRDDITLFRLSPLL